MSTRRRRIGIAAAALLTLAACPLAASRAPAQTPMLRVSAYGDSVLLGAREELLAQFAGQPVTVDAVEDRSLLGAIELFQSAGPALGDVVVLDLGYNDVADPGVFRGRIDSAMAALAGVKHVLWLNQHDWGPGRADMNAELSAAASRYPNLEVIDWNAEVMAHPDEVYGDSIHLTPSGQNAMAALVRRHYDDWLRSLTPTTTTAPPTTSVTAGGPRRTAKGETAAPAAADDGSGFDGRDLAIGAGAGVVVVVLVVGVSFGRRAARRAARRARRGAPPDR
ncbi:MAG TPA: hypothetical protein VK549_06875 [Acidimicrobiia bacterium]|nr:hypothetical protein [Acidimicrobiia bacterium]